MRTEKKRAISNIRRGLVKTLGLLRCYAALVNAWLPTAEVRY